jgi:hypothetical protein
MKKKKKPHWYRMYIGECPVCGSDKSYRVRVFGRKPKDHRKRYVQLKQTYDGCMQ